MLDITKSLNYITTTTTTIKVTKASTTTGQDVIVDV
jgi:hypothetical protein